MMVQLKIRVGNEGDAVDAGLLCHGENVGDLVVACAAIRTQVQFRVARSGGSEVAFHFAAMDRSAVEVVAAIGIERKLDHYRLVFDLLRTDLWQVDRHGLLHHRDGDDENDQEYQHHIHHGCGVDLRHGLGDAALAEGTE
jgi:hypothetical protein